MSRIRIVGGAWRRRLIDVAKLEGLRPTPDAVRETLFNWLGQDLAGLHCLDLFAGSGALGFEAASRGAERVVMVERNPKAFAVMQANARSLDASAVELICGDALTFCSASPGRFHLIFLDPPYRQDWLARIEPFLPPLLHEGARVYCEAEREVAELAGLRAVKAKRAGHVYFQLLESV